MIPMQYRATWCRYIKMIVKNVFSESRGDASLCKNISW